MGAAIIGLAGALLGALTTLLGTVLNDRRQARREEGRWRRDQRAAAYDGALRHLLRAANLRSEFMDGGGRAVVRQEHQREWFDDLVQAQFWLHQLIRYCERSQLDRLQAAAANLDLHVARLVSAESYGGKGFSILAVLQHSIAAVEGSARAEYGDRLPTGAADSQPEPAGPGEGSLEGTAVSQIVMATAGTVVDLGQVRNIGFGPSRFESSSTTADGGSTPVDPPAGQHMTPSSGTPLTRYGSLSNNPTESTDPERGP